MAPLWTCYRASCRDWRGVLRDYFGITRVRCNETAWSACVRRHQKCLERPVTHFRRMDPATLEYTPVGHLMTLEHALAEEALLTAEFFLDGGFIRGGPWAAANVGATARSEIKRVAGLAGQSASRHTARLAVAALAGSLPEASSLRRHLANRPFKLDSGEVNTVRPAAPPMRKSGRSLSGSQKRQKQARRGLLKPGTGAYNKLKWGPSCKENRRKANRRAWVRKRPAARVYTPR
jgi:hypothetical protein